MAIGWFPDIATADTYFGNRYGAEGWASLTTEKTPLLTSAYNRIRFSKMFSVPAGAGGVTLAKLQAAQAELAWYIYIHAQDEDRRKGLQAQGVTTAGVVQETYDADMAGKNAFPAAVLDLLDEFRVKGFFLIDIKRDGA